MTRENNTDLRMQYTPDGLVWKHQSLFLSYVSTFSVSLPANFKRNLCQKNKIIIFKILTKKREEFLDNITDIQLSQHWNVKSFPFDWSKQKWGLFPSTLIYHRLHHLHSNQRTYTLNEECQAFYHKHHPQYIHSTTETKCENCVSIWLKQISAGTRSLRDSYGIHHCLPLF